MQQHALQQKKTIIEKKSFFCTEIHVIEQQLAHLLSLLISRHVSRFK